MSARSTPDRRRLRAIAVVFALCAAGLSILHAHTRPHYRLPAKAAITAARANPGDLQFLAHNHTTSARVIPLDAKLQRVTFFDGSQVVLDTAVGEHGEVLSAEEHVAGAPASGAILANSPWILALLSGLLLLATLVLPLRRIRNLDALVLASLTLTVPLTDARLLGASVICAYLALCYLMIRCIAVGMRAGSDASPAPSTPLLSRLCAGWEPRRRVALLRLMVAATALAFAMITLTSSGYTDVATASLEGATDLLHGVLPYGHIHLALHGDTYPLLSYVLYIPAALWHPVSSGFSDLSGSLATTAAASLLTGLALYRVAGEQCMAVAGEQHAASGADQHVAERQLRTMLAWFAFPPVLLAASSGANDLLLAACVAWMLALRSRAAGSMLTLALGVWVKLVPLVLLAVWIPHPRCSLARACVPALILSALLTGLLFAIGGPGAAPAMLHAMSFQFQRGSFSAPWYTFGLLSLQPFVQAAVIALALAAALRLRADRSLRDDLVRLSALAGALLIGVQLVANSWAPSYLVWVLPFLLAALFTADAPTSASVHGPAAGRLRAAATPTVLRARPGRPRSPSAAGSAR